MDEFQNTLTLTGTLSSRKENIVALLLADRDGGRQLIRARLVGVLDLGNEDSLAAVSDDVVFLKKRTPVLLLSLHACVKLFSAVRQVTKHLAARVAPDRQQHMIKSVVVF